MGDSREEAFQEHDDGDFINVRAGDLPLLTDALENLLCVNPECGVYQRGGYLVEISTVPTKTTVRGVERKKGAHIIADVATARLRELGSRFGIWKKWDARKDGYKAVDCPREVAETLAARNSWQLPVLVAVLGAPTVCPDGNIITKPGYDADTGVYICIDKWKTPKKRPTQEDAIKAREFLEDFIGEFPFVDEAARSTWLAALLTSLIRWSLPTAPFFGFDAPVAGSGKSKLAELIGLVVNGTKPPAMNKPSNDEEVTKSLLSVLMAGDSLLLIDNVEYSISGDVLCSMATSETYRGRVLGQTKMITVSTALTIMMTGNNLVVRGDLSRRMLVARLDPQMENPEERTFKRNVEEYAVEHRQEIVNAALTILRAYALAKRPDQKLSNYGSFEDWSLCVRAPLVWAGAADPYESRQRVVKSDPEREQLTNLLSVWWQIYGKNAVMVRQMLHDISPQTTEDLDNSVSNEDREGLKDALLAVAGDGTKVNSRRLGRRISGWEGRVINGLKIKRSDVVLNSAAWELEKVQDISQTDKPIGLSVSSVKSTANKKTVRKVTNTEQAAKQTDGNRQTDSMIAKACVGLSISTDQLKQQLSADDLDDIDSGAIDAGQLRQIAEHFDQKLNGGKS